MLLSQHYDNLTNAVFLLRFVGTDCFVKGIVTCCALLAKTGVKAMYGWRNFVIWLLNYSYAVKSVFPVVCVGNEAVD